MTPTDQFATGRAGVVGEPHACVPVCTCTRQASQIGDAQTGHLHADSLDPGTAGTMEQRHAVVLEVLEPRVIHQQEPSPAPLPSEEVIASRKETHAPWDQTEAERREARAIHSLGDRHQRCARPQDQARVLVAPGGAGAGGPAE